MLCFSSRRRHTRWPRDWSSDVCSSDLYENLGVIWYDAHGDINTTETSPSGNIHGMPLAVSLGYGHKKLTAILDENPKIKPRSEERRVGKEERSTCSADAPRKSNREHTG